MVGLLNVHKPPGMTSRRVVDLVVRRAGTKRSGHAGTLDPLASGVLVVCLGWATRLVPFVQERRKSYAARFLLGRQSDTDDVAGNVVEVVGAVAPGRAQIEAALPAFTGTIMQVPPQFSAVHVEGVRAHDKARRGEAVSLEPRPVEVHRIALVSYDYPELELDIECGSGTYVRSLGRDLGARLGCGAVMNALVRTAIGEFLLESAVSTEDLTQRPVSDFLLPPLAAVAHLPRQPISAAEIDLLRRGRAVPDRSDGRFSAGCLVALVDEADSLQALAECDCDQKELRPRQVFVAGCSG